jgi:hypothetical protein
MPWKECNPMDERLKFIARLLDGEKMAGLCRESASGRKKGSRATRRPESSNLSTGMKLSNLTLRSPTLKWRRETRLAMKLVDPPAVIENHLLENYSKGLSCLP